MLTEKEKNQLKEIALEKYPIGCTIDQSTAYDGSGGKQKIDSNRVDISSSYDDGTHYYNISVAGSGVYHSKYKIWADVISLPEEYIAPIKNNYEIY